MFAAVIVVVAASGAFGFFRTPAGIGTGAGSPPATQTQQPAAVSDTRKTVAHTVVRVTDESARQPSEVAVAINPTDPVHVVAVSHQGRRPGQAATNYEY